MKSATIVLDGITFVIPQLPAERIVRVMARVQVAIVPTLRRIAGGDVTALLALGSAVEELELVARELLADMTCDGVRVASDDLDISLRELWALAVVALDINSDLSNLPRELAAGKPMPSA
jgi:hypothetical protein